MDLKGIMDGITLDIKETTKILFETMIMLDLNYGDASLIDETQIKTDVIGMVSFTGQYHGVVGIFCSKKICAKSSLQHVNDGTGGIQ